MRDSYTRAQALKLTEYYRPLLLGKAIDLSDSTPISAIDLEPSGKDKFLISAYATRDGALIKRSLTTIALEHSLSEPAAVLKSLHK
jgi:hypothetical protein